MSIRTKILEKGKIIQEQLIRVLINFDDRITALEEEDDSSSNKIKVLEDKVKALEDGVEDLDDRVKALEDGDEALDG